MRSRIFIFSFLAIVILGAGWGIFRLVTRSSSFVKSPVIQRSSQEIHTAWISGVQQILQAYDVKREPLEARDALLGLSVVANDQSTHLALVLAFQALIDQHSGAAKKLVDARQDFLYRTGQP